MKLRMKANSVRLRVSRSEMARLLSSGRVEESVRFSAKEESILVYALEHSSSVPSMTVRQEPRKIVVTLPTSAAHSWAETEQIGIYAQQSLGEHGELELMVEKDFPCGDPSDAENADKFPNPGSSGTC